MKKIALGQGRPKEEEEKIPWWYNDPDGDVLTNIPSPVSDRTGFNKWYDNWTGTVQKWLDEGSHGLENYKGKKVEDIVSEFPDLLDKKTIGKRLIESRFNGSKEVDRHKGFLSGLTFNPASWTTFFNGGHQLNDRWARKELAKGFDKSDPFTAAQQREYYRGLSKEIDEDQKRKAVNALGALHVAGTAVENSIAGTTYNVARALTGNHIPTATKLLSGMTAEEARLEAARRYKRDTGDAAGAEQLYRDLGTAGLAASVVENVAELGASSLANGVSATANAARSAEIASRAHGAVPKVVAATRGLEAAQAIDNLGKMVRGGRYVAPLLKYIPRTMAPKAVANGFRLASDAFTDQGQINDGFRGFVGNTIMPYGASIAENLPAWQTAGEYIPLFGSTLNRGIGHIPKVGPYAQTHVSPMVSRLYQWGAGSSENMMPIMRPFSRVLKYQAISPFLSPVMNLKEMYRAALSGEPVKWTFGELPDVALDVTGNFIGRHSNAAYTLLNSGDNARQAAKTFNEIDNNRYLREDLAESYGIPGASAEEIKRSVYEHTALNRSIDVLDWINKSTDGKFKIPMNELSEEDRKLVATQTYDTIYKVAVQGGPVDFNQIFSHPLVNPYITPQQKVDIMSQYLLAEDRGNNNWYKTNFISEGVTYAIGGSDYIGERALRSSPVAQNAMESFLYNMSADIARSPDPEKRLTEYSSGSEGGDAMKVLGAMPEDKLKRGFSPLVNGTKPKVLFSVAKAYQKDSDAKDELAKPVKAIHDNIKDRLAKDLEYRKDFLVDLAEEESDIPADAELKESYMQTLDKTDLKATFAKMKGSELRKVAVYLRKQASGQQSDDPVQKARVEKYTAAIKDRCAGLIKEDFISNLPIVSALWADSQGWDGLGSFLANPAYFWGTAFLLLTGGCLLLSNLSEDDDDSVKQKDIAKLVQEALKQRELAVGNDEDDDAQKYLRALS